jgi:hypothetical protein
MLARPVLFAAVFGVVSAVVLGAGCVEPPSPTAEGPVDASVQDATGTVGAQLTLPGGEQLSVVSYTLTNGANTYTGTVDVSSQSSASFVVAGVASGAGYVLKVTGVSDDRAVTCSGSSPPLAVSNRATTMVLVQLVCIVTSEAGGVIIGGTPSNCAVWNTIVANPSFAQTGGSTTLNAAATAPNPGAITFAWSVISGSGTISNNASAVTANDAGATDTATFTCPLIGNELDTIELVVGDGPLPDGGSCPPVDTTGTVQVLCGIPPCFGVPGGTFVATPNTPTGSCPAGTVNLGTPDSRGEYCCVRCLLGTGNTASPDTATGSCPSGEVNTGTLKDTNGNYCCSIAPPDAGAADAASDGGADGGDAGPCTSTPPPPCTAAGQSCCVPCPGSASGVCTPTEAMIVAHDVAKGQATMGVDNGCYACLYNGGCLDDVTFGDNGHECEDLPNAAFDAGAQAGKSEDSLCLQTLSCLLSTSCASAAVSGCYCGTAGVATSCQGNPAPGPINGACAQPIADGLGYPVSDGTDITKHLTDTTKPAGVADQILQCALSNTCTACLQ